MENNNRDIKDFLQSFDAIYYKDENGILHKLEYYGAIDNTLILKK